MESENSEIQLRIITSPNLPKPATVHVRTPEVKPIIPEPDSKNVIIIYTKDRHNSRCICACVVLFIIIIAVLSILYKH